MPEDDESPEDHGHERECENECKHPDVVEVSPVSPERRVDIGKQRAQDESLSIDSS